MEAGLSTANAYPEPKVEQFRRDHASKFLLGFKGYVAGVLRALALAAVCVLLWKAGAGDDRGAAKSPRSSPAAE